MRGLQRREPAIFGLPALTLQRFNPQRGVVPTARYALSRRRTDFSA
jgi:hypothetical protein